MWPRYQTLERGCGASDVRRARAGSKHVATLPGSRAPCPVPLPLSILPPVVLSAHARGRTASPLPSPLPSPHSTPCRRSLAHVSGRGATTCRWVPYRHVVYNTPAAAPRYYVAAPSGSAAPIASPRVSIRDNHDDRPLQCSCFLEEFESLCHTTHTPHSITPRSGSRRSRPRRAP